MDFRATGVRSLTLNMFLILNEVKTNYQISCTFMTLKAIEGRAVAQVTTDKHSSFTPCIALN